MSKQLRRSMRTQAKVTTEFALCCVENCGEHFHLKLSGEVSLDSIRRQLAAQDWIISLLSPPGVKPPFCGPLCPACAKRIYPASMRAAAKWGTPEMVEVKGKTDE